MTTLRQQLQQTLREILELYGHAVENTLVLPGGAPQAQWNELQQQLRDALAWADLIAASATRYKGIGERIRVPQHRDVTIAEITEINPWAAEHVERTSALVDWRAEQTAVIDQLYVEHKAKMAHYAGVPVDEIIDVVPHYRMDRFRRDQIGEIANVAQQVQLSVPIIGDQFPFAILDSRGDARVRPTHAAADGTIAPRTHPIWSVIRPKNGFNCRCVQRLISRREAIKLGLMTVTGRNQLEGVSWGSPAAKAAYELGIPFHGKSYANVPRVIARQMFPDPGFCGPKYIGGISGVAA